MMFYVEKKQTSSSVLLQKDAGFTIIEVIVAVAILSVVAAIAITDFVLLQKNSDLNNNVQEFVNVVKLAQSNALSSQLNSQYGVYLNTSVAPNQYVLFTGASYATRDTSADQVHSLQNTMEFNAITLGGGNEIVFDKLTGALTGASDVSRSVAIRVVADPASTKTVYIANSGVVTFNQAASGSDANRVQDSRHVHIDYNRNIDTANENITLTFDGTTTEVFPIASYLNAGEIEWSGTISVGGVNQTVEIHTHRLNATDTEFSIHRDERLNTKSLAITISGDSSGSLAEYSADGLTTNHTSIYVTNFTWQ